MTITSAKEAMDILDSILPDRDERNRAKGYFDALKGPEVTVLVEGIMAVSNSLSICLGAFPKKLQKGMGATINELDEILAQFREAAKP